MLTCNSEFRNVFPHVYQGLVKGIIDVDRLVAHEIVLPVKEELNIRKSSSFNRRAITNMVYSQIWKSVHGKFPDGNLGPKVVKAVAEHFCDQLEEAVKEAEGEQSFFQWFTRQDVENTVTLRQKTSLNHGGNSVILQVEGTAQVTKKRGDMLQWITLHQLVMDLDIEIKAIFLNGGQLREMDRDPLFVDRVQIGENRFMNQFMPSY